MPALVETMFYVRETPWHGLGTKVDEAPTSAEAIKLAGLDWNVSSEPIYTTDNIEIPNMKANIRETDRSILGIVSDRYKVVQNKEAFEFTDSLINEEVKYETAGALKNGKVVWMLAKMPERKILDDKFDPYICFTNSFDGSGAIRACMTPVRVVCQNTLNLALNTTTRQWSTRHIGDIEGKLIEAQHTLGLANDYMDGLSDEANKLVEVKVTDAQLEAIFDELYPVDVNKDSQRKINNVLDFKDKLFKCYAMPDIAQYKGTAWGIINATTDLVDHMAPARMTENYRENKWGTIMLGHPLVDLMYKKLNSLEKVEA